MAHDILNRGYILPEKSKGRINLSGRDVYVACAWSSPEKTALSLKGEHGEGAGTLSVNPYKTGSQPDWRGRFRESTGSGSKGPDAQNQAGQEDGSKGTGNHGMEWLVSGWNRDRDGEFIISISLTDPATLPSRRPSSQAQSSTTQSPTTQSPTAPSSTNTPPSHSPSAPPLSAATPSTPSSPMPADDDDFDIDFKFGDVFTPDGN